MSGIDGVEGFRPNSYTPARQASPTPGFSGHLDKVEQAGVPSITKPLAGALVRGFSEEHPGVDIASPVGSPVRSALAGVVESAGWAGDRGNLMVVRSGETRAYYGHLEGFEVRPGSLVEAGQVIGASGATGATQQPSLHFELRVSGSPVDPSLSLA